MAIGDPNNVTTGEVRFSYVHLMKPYAYNEGDPLKYSCTVLLPKSDTVTVNRVLQAIDAAKQKGASDKWGGVIPPRIDMTFYDGDGVKPSDGMPFGPECKGHFVISAKCNEDHKPEIVDQFGNFIINPSEIYSGMYGRINLEFYPYDNRGKKGISCSLGPVMKTRDGEPLGGTGPTAAQAFGFVGQAQPAAQPAYQAQQMPQPQGYSVPQAQPGYYQPPTQAPMPGAVDPITGLPIDTTPF